VWQDNMLDCTIASFFHLNRSGRTLTGLSECTCTGEKLVEVVYVTYHSESLNGDVLFLGFSKDAMKMVQLYRTKERFEPSPECQALVNAKYQ
jgi:hypothetical protein